MIVVFLGLFLYDYSRGYDDMKLWYDPVVDEKEVKVAQWIRDNLPTDRNTVYAGDLFANELLMTVTNSPVLIGGDWSSIPRSEVARFADSQEIFLTTNSGTAHNLCKKWGVNYVFLSSRMTAQSFFGYGWVRIPRGAFDKFFNASSYFQLVYNTTAVSFLNEGVWFLRVLD